MARPSRLLGGLLLVLLLAACGSPATSPTASPAALPAARSESPQSATPSATPSSAPSAATGATIDPALVHACLGLDEGDCTQVLEAVAAAMPADAPVVYAEIGPFGCATGDQCPNTLLARPAGSVTVELAAGDPLAFQVSLAPDGTPAVAPGEAFTVAVAPSSTRGQLSSPMPFTLGHCGLWSGVDVDGSWWDPVGFVDPGHGDSINAASGTFVPVDPNHATFTSDGGFSVNLLRRLGDKHLPLCM